MGATRREVQTSGDLVMAPRVPHGLAAAVEGLTREVIRHRPEDIYDFAAQHFEQLLHLRDEYGAATNLPGRSGNSAALREMNRSLKQRYASSDERMETNEIRRGGWSLNETAKVMERHRSIFGDEGRRMSPEEVRALANEKENKSFGGKSRTGRRTKSRGDLETNEGRQNSSERYAKRATKEREQKSKSDSCGVKIDSDGAPILMTGIGAMLAKDIKSELRKNRNGSRDGRGKTSGRERNELELGGTRVGIARRDDSARRSDAAAKWNRSADTRSETDNQKYKTEPGEADSRSGARVARALSMDRVRDSVVKKFRTSDSWDELVSTSYVDKVQEVIDETTPTIREKVRELSDRLVSSGGRRSRQDGYRSVDESTSTSEKSNQTEDVGSRSAVSRSKRSRKSVVRNKSKTSLVESRGNDSLEGIETLASELEVRADAKDEIREFSGTDHPKEQSRRKRVGKNGRASGDSDGSDYLDVAKKLAGGSSLSLPAVRPPSSRNTSRSVSRSDSDNLTLPPISPETPKPAKPKETLVLPCLSPSMGANLVDSPSEAANRSRIVEIGETEDPFEDAEEPELNLPDAPTDEVFKDSLNVTPEVVDVPPRPDSLEPALTIGEVEKSDGNTTDRGEIGKEEDANNTVRRKLMEIEETEKRIEQIFAPSVEKSKDIDENEGSMRRKLMEIEAVEKRIESAFHSAREKTPRHEAGTLIGGEENAEVAKTDRQDESSALAASIPGISVDEARTAHVLYSGESVSPELATDVENGRRSTVQSEEASSRTSDSVQNSYILTEGSPFDIPDSVTTVIIAESQSSQDGFGSGVGNINVELGASDESTEIPVGFDEAKANSDDKLVKVLENVADFPGESKASPELGSRRQDDVGQIGTELADLGQAEHEEAAPSESPVTLAKYHFSDCGGEETREEEKRVIGDEEIGIGEETVTDSTRKEESSGPEEITGATKMAENLEKYVATDSSSTGSSDEVKETTISDDGGISGAESSVTSQFCEDETDPRNSESSNEVKETTISDRPAENAGQNLYNLAPRCYGSMPHVPELNLDSLQDITVSSFQLSDDAATKENTATSQESGENGTSFTEMIEDVGVGEVEDIIVKEQVAIREDPCVKITTYVTEPDTEITKGDAVDTDPGVAIDVTPNPAMKGVEEDKKTPISGESAEKQLPESNRFDTDSLRDFEDLENRVSKADSLQIEIERTDAIDTSELSGQILETVGSEDPLCATSPNDGGARLDSAIRADAPIVADEKSRVLSEDTDDLLLLSSSRGDDSKSRVAGSVVPKEIDVTSAFGDIVVAESLEFDGDDEHPLINVDSSLPSNPIAPSVLLLSETPTQAEPVVPTADLHARSSESSVSEVIDGVASTDKNNSSSSVVPEVLVPAEGVANSTSADPVTTESRDFSEDPKFDLSSAPSGGISSIERVDTKRDTSAPSIVERPETTAPSDSDEPRELVVSGTLQSDTNKNIALVVSEEPVTIESPDTHESATSVVLEVSDPLVPQATDAPEDSTSLVTDVALIVSPDKLDRSAANSLEDARLSVPPEKEVDSALSRAILPSPDDSNVPVDYEIRPGSNHAMTAVKHNESATPADSVVVPTQTNQPTQPTTILPLADDSNEPVDPAADKEISPGSNHAATATKDNESVTPADSEVVPTQPDQPTQPTTILPSADDSIEPVDHEIRPGSNDAATVMKDNESVTSADSEAVPSQPDQPDQPTPAQLTTILPSADDSNESIDPAADNEIRPGSNHSTTAVKANESVPPADSAAVLTQPNPTRPTPILLEKSDEIGREPQPVDPPRAEVVTNDVNGEGASGERLEYHIYVPEMTGSEESSTTESSTFNSAATKIQAGVRGFLTRRRLQSAQRRSSTLDSVPSIQDSFATDATHLEPIEELGLGQAATTIQSSYRGYRARQRLRREDAVQKKTLSVENAFLENGLQHTGEFHDCLPLPMLEAASARIEASAGAGAPVEDDAATASLSEEMGSGASDFQKFTDKDSTGVANSDYVKNRVVTRSGKYSVSPTDATGNASTDTAEARAVSRGLNLVMAVVSSNALQDQYLNFITSVEEVQDETATSLLHGDTQDPRASDVSSLPSSNVGLDSLSMDKPNDVSWGNASIREPLAIPGTPTGVVIEELPGSAATDSITDANSAGLTTDEASGLNLTDNAESSYDDKSLCLPGLSLEPEIEETDQGPKQAEASRASGKSSENPMASPKKPVDSVVFSTNLGGENEPLTKAKPILEVTVTPRDLLALTKASQGSQVSGERAESPVTMMQIVPKSVDEKFERSDDDRPGDVGLDSKQVRPEVEERGEGSTTEEKADDSAKNAELTADEEPKNGSDVKLGRSSTEESSERLSKTYSLEK